MKVIRLSIAMLFVLVLGLSACGPQPTAAPAQPAEPTQVPAQPAVATEVPAVQATEVPTAVPGPKAGGNLVWAIQQEPDTLDWHKSALASSYNVFSYLSAALFQLAPDNKIVPWLAESYKVSDDGLNYDITLRGDVKFSDGSALTAKDYVWTLKRALDPKTASPVAGSVLGPVKEVTETGPNSFRITLSSAFAPPVIQSGRPGIYRPNFRSGFHCNG